ncbi:MAG TPA: WecB/TagA/CpsF family glycosyltransferase [Chthoniobacterales bacterium]
MLSLKTVNVLGLQVAAVDYTGAIDAIKSLARRPQPAAVSACNTHLVAESNLDPAFGEIMSRFDLILPDGMPLIWLMNLDRAGLKNRVYGPYLMEKLIQATPEPWKHYFFGSSQECLDQLLAAVRRLQPGIHIAGAFSPPFRQWTEDDHAEHAARISETSPDFIWVALGGGRQERWIMDHLHRFGRGVFFGIGDGFELLAGRRPYAPAWVQRAGLTWLYRLSQEPHRLWKRYFKYNALFIWYALQSRFRR